MFRRYRHIHFVGIGGIGMSGKINILLDLGGSTPVVATFRTCVFLDVPAGTDV
jgi:hypothetical protein